MRSWVLISLLLLALPASARAAPVCDLHAKSAAEAGPACVRAWFDANLKLNQIQLVGTAESYKLRPSPSMLGLIRMGSAEDARELDFAEPSIASQLDLGARSLEFDVAYDPKGGLYAHPAGALMAMELMSDQYVHDMSQPGFKVIHILDIDFNSSCMTLVKCLQGVAAWSRAHPDHLPIVIGIRSNDDKTPMPGATHPMKFDPHAFDALDSAILSVLRPNEIITPDLVQGRFSSLRDAVQAGTWPTLGAARGKLIFLLDDGKEKAEMYRGRRHSLEKRVMFIATNTSSPAAAFVTIENPARDPGVISRAVKAGFMVHTFADADTKEARAGNTTRRDKAFASGAQVISTDFFTADPSVGKYQVRVPGGHVAQCDVQFLAERCGTWDLESGHDSAPGKH
ncbi:MAG TPA: Ca2+-dependent phosphoinositide-specific phospholipase C [Rhizomicrobium sp.]